MKREREYEEEEESETGKPQGRGWGKEGARRASEDISEKVFNEDEDILKKVCNGAKDIDEGEDILEVVSDDAGTISEEVIDEDKDKLFQRQNNFFLNKIIVKKGNKIFTCISKVISKKKTHQKTSSCFFCLFVKCVCICVSGKVLIYSLIVSNV